jgi:hypothetical protein
VAALDYSKLIPTRVRRWLQSAFSPSAGHDHDGLNSKPVPMFFNYPVEDLAADGDIAARTLLVVPTGKIVRIASASIIPQGTAAGIDDANTCVITLANNTDAIVTKTYNTAAAFPADAALTSLGTLSTTHKVMAAGKALKLSVTNGTAANPPAFMLQLVYTLENAA